MTVKFTTFPRTTESRSAVLVMTGAAAAEVSVALAVTAGYARSDASAPGRLVAVAATLLTNPVAEAESAARRTFTCSVSVAPASIVAMVLVIVRLVASQRRPLALTAPSAIGEPELVTGDISAGRLSVTTTSYAGPVGVSGVDSALVTVIVNVAIEPAAIVAGATDLATISDGSATPTFASLSPVDRADTPVLMEARHVAASRADPAVIAASEPTRPSTSTAKTVPSEGTVYDGRPTPATSASIWSASPGKYTRT